MSHSFLDSVLRGAEALAARDPVSTLPDPDLVRRFAAGRDPAAFAVLVRRHGPLVWGVCRNLLPADADAEDAFQATFLALVRSAGTIRQSEALGGWLHGVAYRVAMKARRTAARRKKREAIAAVPEPDTPIPDAAWDDLQAAVHEEVSRLPEKLRLPFVLCGLQGRQQKDVAKQLGWKVGTVSGRLTLARQRLLDRLARRGVPVGVAAGAAVLGMASGTAAVPHSVSSKAIAAAATPDAVSPVVTALARGVTQMYLTRTKLLIAGVLVAGALTTGISSRLVSTAEAQPPSSSEPSPEAIKKALDYLRTQQARDRWEYKFVPVEKALVATDLQKLLSASDREGWEYCGTQELVAKSGAATPHMVFKRPRGSATADDTRAAAVAGLAALAGQVDAADRDDRKKKLEALRYYEALMESHRKSEVEADRVRGANKSQQDALLLAEQLKKQAAEERDRAAKLEDMLKKMRREQDDLILKIKELQKTRRPAEDKDPELVPTTKSMTIPLKHVDAAAALGALEKVAPVGGYKASIDTRTNSLTIYGPPEILDKLKAIVDKAVDVKLSDTDAADMLDLAVIRLKYIDAKAAQDALAKTLSPAKLNYKVSFDSTSNSLIIAGSAEAVLAVRKVIDTLDRAGPAK